MERSEKEKWMGETAKAKKKKCLNLRECFRERTDGLHCHGVAGRNFNIPAAAQRILVVLSLTHDMAEESKTKTTTTKRKRGENDRHGSKTCLAYVSHIYTRCGSNMTIVVP
jgi:hypothetical protein